MLSKDFFHGTGDDLAVYGFLLVFAFVLGCLFCWVFFFFLFVGGFLLFFGGGGGGGLLLVVSFVGFFFRSFFFFNISCFLLTATIYPSLSVGLKLHDNRALQTG